MQSVAVRLIVEREREIDAFVPAEYWSIGGTFTAAADAAADLSAKWRHFTLNGEPNKADREKWLADHDAFAAELVELGGAKFEPNNKADCRRAAELLGLVIDKDQTVEDADAKARPSTRPCSPAGSAGCRRSPSGRWRRSGRPAGRRPRSSPARSSRGPAAGSASVPSGR